MSINLWNFNQTILFPYRGKMKALRAFFEEENRKRDEALAQKPQSIEDDADFESVSKYNDEWNRSVAKIREARLENERIAMRQEIQWQLEQQREYEEEKRQKTNELVLREKVKIRSDCDFIGKFHNVGLSFQEAAKSFIVRENFDEALELALQNKTDFNYAIDVKGSLYPGRTGDKKQTEKTESN